MHEVTLSVTRCSSESTGHRPWLPRGVHMPGLGRIAAGRTLKRPPHVPALTRSCSVSLALAPIVAKPSAAVAIVELCHTRTPTTLQHHPIHLAHSSTIISSSSPTRHCHRSSLGNATFHIAVIAMFMERHRASSSPWPALSTAPLVMVKTSGCCLAS